VTELVAWLKKKEWVEFQARSPLAELQVVKAAVANCIDKCEHFGFDAASGHVMVKLLEGDRVYMLRFTALSHGVRSMLAMVADAAWRCAVLNPHLGADAAKETPGVVLIDEIDLHLHPSWQRRVVDDLKRAFPKVQFIATTHSPFIIQSLEPGELYDLGSPDGEPRDDYADQSIEDIADKVQGVEQSAVSENRRKMIEAGRRYYELLAQGDDASPTERERLKRELDQIAAIFSDNVAYHAQLAVMESDREAHGLGKDDQ
jgi:predicted ATP-binding protein involved in virulence